MSKLELGILNDTGYNEWANRRRSDFLETVDPVQVYQVNGEHVVWARRSGVAEKGFFDFHHIGCDCLGNVPRGQSEIKAMLGCDALQSVLLTEAETVVRQSAELAPLLPQLTVEDDGQTHLTEEEERIGQKFVYEALLKTIVEPAKCQGNIRTGLHIVPILQHMMGDIPEKPLDSILVNLANEGRILREDPMIGMSL